MTTSADNAGRRGVRSVLLPVVGLLTLASCAGDSSESVVSFSGATMGTRYTVRLASGSHFRDWPPNQKALQQKIDQRLAQLNRLVSTYDDGSELSRFNRLNNTDWFGVSAETVQLVKSAVEIATRTEGAFDPTVGPVVNLWGFGPDNKRQKPPSDERIAQAMESIGYQQIETRDQPPSIRKLHPGIYLDLSGIAKGYASDCVSELLTELGYHHSMVEIGGEVRTRGRKTAGASWLIGVEKSDSQGDPVQLAVSLDDAGMATSGDYHNFFEYQGVRYSHTIDPRAGRPVNHQLAAVSVVAPTCMEADAVATAVLVKGDQLGYDWCEEQGVAALLLVREGTQVVERRTTAFKQLATDE